MEKIYIHPEYDDRNILHDIALAKVDRPFDMDSFTATVCMPAKASKTEEIGEILSLVEKYLCGNQVRKLSQERRYIMLNFSTTKISSFAP